ncbi:MAG: aminotransferase class I/II-fold pyridoxal phosphate-dependent enzyme [Exilibacterium sp.]
MPISDLSKLPDYSKLIASGIDKIQAFKPLAELQVLNNIAKLDSNESFLGPSPAAIEVLLAKAGSESHLYPETSGQQLKTALATRTNTHPDCITLGNGSNDVLDIVARTFCRPGDEIIFSQYAFAAYSILTAIVGAEAVQTPATTGYGHDLKAMAGAITPKTKLIFIANPNNPTGTWSDCDALETLLDSVPSEVRLSSVHFPRHGDWPLSGLAMPYATPRLPTT